MLLYFLLFLASSIMHAGSCPPAFLSLASNTTSVVMNPTILINPFMAFYQLNQPDEYARVLPVGIMPYTAGTDVDIRVSRTNLTEVASAKMVAPDQSNQELSIFDCNNILLAFVQWGSIPVVTSSGTVNAVYTFQKTHQDPIEEYGVVDPNAQRAQQQDALVFYNLNNEMVAFSEVAIPPVNQQRIEQPRTLHFLAYANTQSLVNDPRILSLVHRLRLVPYLISQADNLSIVMSVLSGTAFVGIMACVLYSFLRKKCAAQKQASMILPSELGRGEIELTPV